MLPLLLLPAALLRLFGHPWWYWVLAMLASMLYSECGQLPAATPGGAEGDGGARLHSLCIAASLATLAVTAAHAGAVHWFGGERQRQSLVLDVVLLPAVCAALSTRSARKLLGMKRWAASGDLNLVALYESWALSSLFTLFAHVASTSGGCYSLFVCQFLVLNVAFSVYEYLLKDWAPCDLCWRYAAASCYELYLSQQAFLEGVMFFSSCAAIAAIGRLEATQHARLHALQPFRKFLSAKVMMSVLFAQPVALDLWARYLPTGWAEGEKELLNLRVLVLESMALAFFNVTAFPPRDFCKGNGLCVTVAPPPKGHQCEMRCRAKRSTPPSSPSHQPASDGCKAKQDLRMRRCSRMGVYFTTLVFWATFFSSVYVLPLYGEHLRATDGTCASLPPVLHATPRSDDLFVAGEDRSFYHCDAVRYRCDDGYVGTPIAVCGSDGVFRVSQQCSAYLTRTGCHCLPAWRYCSRFGYWDCADYHGCAAPKGWFSAYEWCLTTSDCAHKWDRCDVHGPSVAAPNASNIPLPLRNQSRAAASPWRRGVKNSTKALRNALAGDFLSARESFSPSSLEGVLAESAHATIQRLGGSPWVEALSGRGR